MATTTTTYDYDDDGHDRVMCDNHVCLHAGYTSPFGTMRHSPEWFCGSCGRWERLTSRRALAPLSGKHGYAWARVAEDGD